LSIITTILFSLILLTSFSCLLSLYSVFRVVRHSNKLTSLSKSGLSSENIDKREKKKSEECFPPVSILKPLQGTDPGLKTNLSSFCRLEYPAYELVFCLEKEEDPALKTVGQLRQEYPEVSIKIAIDQNRYGYNPKVNNLIRGLREASYDLILISDADVCIDRDYLKETVVFFQDPSVGMVTNLISGKGKGTLGAILENLNLNFFVLGGTCFLNYFFGYTCVTGKSVLLRKEDLENIGGFSSVKNFLAEDQILEKKLIRLGKKVVLSNHLITSNNCNRPLSKFFTRNLRWSQMRMQLGGIGYLSELLGNPFLFAIALYLLSSFSTFSFSALLGTGFFKIILELIQGKLIQAEAGFFPYLIVPLKDLLIGLFWFIPFFKTSIEWRGSKFKLKRYTELEPL
jgi:ceramide glucosyltransferase